MVTPGRERYGEGRFVDPQAGLLQGEAADQRVPKERATAESGAPLDVFGGIPSQQGVAGSPTYYDRPVLKEPTWIWAVPAYFYAGGAAGAAATLGGVAQVLDREGLRELIGACRWVAAAGTVAGTALLIHDLGRPERFLNMLRVFRPTSPMNVGSWILAAAAPAAVASAVLSRAQGPAGALGDASGITAAVLGPPLAGYTAVLLSNTAVPVWQSARRSLPGLFMSSGASAAASFIDLLTLPRREQSVVRRFGITAKIADLAAAAAVDREAGRVERVSRPLKGGVSGFLWKTSKALTAVSLGLSLVPGARRWPRIASAVTGTAGAVALRFAVFHAGTASSRDPRATFEQQRAGLGAAEVTGRPAVAGREASSAVPAPAPPGIS